MLTHRIIPCLDVRDGRVVKGIRFQGLRDAGSPPERAANYEAQGADELVLLDVSATPEGRSHQVDTVKAVRANLSIPLTTGGGVRVADDAARLLEAGADKVSINTAAVDNTELLSDMAKRFGVQCTVLAVDAKRTENGSWEAVVQSGKKGTGLDVIEWVKRGVDLGAGEILLTSWDRDGTRSGYDLELLKAVSDVINVPVIASGGAANSAQLIEALDAGADAVLAASIFHDNELTVMDLKRDLQKGGKGGKNMIIPSIDLMDGQAVQLIGGKKKALEAGDPIPLAEKFRLAGEIAVIDLDAALGRGSNADVIKELVKIAPCRVGGGIRDTDAAYKWLDAGAVKVIIGTSAVPEVLKPLPKERVIAALDAEYDEIVVEGWQKKTGLKVVDRIRELRELVGGFLLTFVEIEGSLKGIDLERVKMLVSEAKNAKVTIAGGVKSIEEIAEADYLGADAQVGMAIYTGKLDIGDCISAPLKSDRKDGLWPTVIVDEYEKALGLAYSNAESVREAVKTRKGVYHSRKRGLWVKGLTSGATQELLKIDLDCDRDTLRFTVKQDAPGFCHLNTHTCWGEDKGLTRLYKRLQKRIENAPEGSYTKRLFDDSDLLGKKIIEEANELCEAKNQTDITWEAADVIYFTLVKMVKEGVAISDIERELERRSLKLTRRPGNAK